MNPITIDGQQYNPQDLSEEARAHLAHLAYIENELQRMQMGINVLRISRQKIGDLLRAALPGTTPAAAAPVEAKAPAKSGKAGRK